MEQQPYVFELPDGRTVTATRIIQRDSDGLVATTFLVDCMIEDEPASDDEVEQLARRHAGFH